MIDADACTAGVSSFDAGTCSPSNVVSLSGGNGIQSTGVMTPTLSMSGTFLGTLVVEKNSAVAPDAPLTLLENQAGADAPGRDFTRLTLRETSVSNNAFWTLAARTNHGTGVTAPEPNPNQLFFNVYFDNDGPEAGNDSINIRGQGDVTFSFVGANKARVEAETVTVSNGSTDAAITAASPTVDTALRVVHSGGGGVAIRVFGGVDIMNTVAPGITPSTLYNNAAANHAGVNGVRLPIYRVSEVGSVAIVDANCQNTDVVVGGSCTAESASFYVISSEPDVSNSQWRCQFSGAGAHTATASCLKSY
jgi:hypothetical protein